MRKLAIIMAMACAALVAGCGTESANMHIDGEQSYASLADQRAAVEHVRIMNTLPPGAFVLGDVDASRCHRNALDKPPSVADVRNDLIVAAYARGADGIANVRVETRVLSGLFKNCWHTLVGTATAYRAR